MYSRFDNIEIAGMATTLPAKEINNLEFAEQFGEQVVKKQIKVTGITTRRVAEENQTALDLMVCSAKRLMHKLEWSGEQVDILVFASGYNSCAIPATSYLAQNYLNIKSDCVLYDINLACTGTVDGLYTLMALMQAYPEGARGLLLVGETPTAGEAKNDKTTSMLSSDCGVAIALEKKTAAPVYMSQHTDGSRYEVLVRRDLNDHIHMDGMEVFQFAITDVVKEIENCFEKYAIDKEQIDYFVIHQAQKFIVQSSGAPEKAGQITCFIN